MTLKRTTIAALIAVAFGTTALATATLADSTSAPANSNGLSYQLSQGPNTGPGNIGPGKPGPGNMGPGKMGPGRGWGMGWRFGEARGSSPMRPGAMKGGRAGAGGLALNLACSDRGAEALEIGLVRLSYRLDLTADQQKLFETLRTDALAAQTSFADQCRTAAPDKTAANARKPDVLERMKDRLGVQQARLDAMNKLMPDVEALYSSLSDDQKAQFGPHRPGHGKRPAMTGTMQRPVDLPETPASPAAPVAAAPVLNG